MADDPKIDNESDIASVGPPGVAPKAPISFANIKVQKGDRHQVYYCNQTLLTTTSEDVRFIFCRIAAHRQDDTRIYQEADVYMSYNQALKLYTALGRQIQTWKESNAELAKSMLEFDPEK